MTGPAHDSPTPAPAEKAGIVEDFIDIFYAPATVFARRREGSGWLPMLLVTVVVALSFLTSRGVMQPVFDAEFARQAAKMAENPQMTPEMIEGMRKAGPFTFIAGAILGTPLAVIFLGLVMTLVAKLVDSQQGVRASIMIAAYAFVPRVVGAVLTPIQLRFMSPESLDGYGRLTLSPARFMDPDTASAMMVGLATRFDLFVLWTTVLVAIGVSVVGKVSRASGWVVAIIIWLAGALPVVWGAIAQG